MKRFATMAGIALLCVALLCVAAACGKKAAPAAENKAPANTLSAATTLKIQEAGLQLDVPAGWQAEKRDEQQYTVSSPDSAFQAVFVPVDDEVQARQAAATFKQKLQNVKPEGATKELTRNGLKVLVESGTAEFGGAPQRWSVEVISADKPVVVYTQISERGQALHDATELMRSIKKIG